MSQMIAISYKLMTFNEPATLLERTQNRAEAFFKVKRMKVMMSEQEGYLYLFIKLSLTLEPNGQGCSRILKVCYVHFCFPPYKLFRNSCSFYCRRKAVTSWVKNNYYQMPRAGSTLSIIHIWLTWREEWSITLKSFKVSNARRIFNNFSF